MILTIKKHADRWKEVIQILEMLGGENRHNFDGSEDYNYFTLEINNEICGTDWITDDHIVYTLEEFKAEYPVILADHVFMNGYSYPLKISELAWNGSEVEVQVYGGNGYEWVSLDRIRIQVQASRKSHKSQIEVNRCLLKNPIRNAQELLDIEKELALASMSLPENITIHSYGIGSSEFLGWFYSDPTSADDTLLLPTTYEACCDILGIKGYQPFDIRGYKNDFLAAFQNLLICRDAWWKVLDWKPDQGDGDEDGLILIFPSDQIKERFYETFGSPIEYVFKGLLL